MVTLVPNLVYQLLEVAEYTLNIFCSYIQLRFPYVNLSGTDCKITLLLHVTETACLHFRSRFVPSLLTDTSLLSIQIYVTNC